MSSQSTTNTSYPIDTVPGAIGSSKPRYALLDGLRGVAAVLVVWSHFFEAFCTSGYDMVMNHYYLAVDFFFILSGFVIGYAYDDRWRSGMTVWQFVKRRVIRLHPMVALAVVLGAIAWMVQGSVRWDGTAMPLSSLIGCLVLGFFLIPVLPGSAIDVRGNNEMFPLNGPSWSLFFEYIGSFLYAFVLHRLSKRALQCVVLVSAAALAYIAFSNMSGAYNIGVGWTLSDGGFWGGFFRMSFSFSLGLLMSRNFKPVRVRGAFWIGTVVLAAVVAMPYVGSPEMPWFNAGYDLLCTFVVFPVVVYLAASGSTTDATSTRVCEFLGAVSYPLYISHYPVMYLFYAWVWANGYTFSQVWPVCVALLPVIVFLAWVWLRVYDQPVRRWLARRWLSRRS